MTPHALMHLTADRHGVLCRRTFLRYLSAGAATAATLNFTDAVTSQASELRKQGMACILLSMNGGPRQFETSDPKPGTETGAPTKAIDTAASGIQVAKHWPSVARQMKDISLIRTVTNKE